MGYTHYFNFKNKTIPEKTWNNICKDATDIFKILPEHSNSSGGYYEKEKLAIDCIMNDNIISFNAIDEELAHNIFYINRKSLNKGFCKTDRKPYDFFVQAVLLIMKKHLNDDISISTDGYIEDWENVYKFLKDNLDYNLNLSKAVEV